jgi:hypothetical protein
MGQRVKCPACAIVFTAGGDMEPEEAAPSPNARPAEAPPESQRERVPRDAEDRPRRRDEEDRRPSRRRYEDEDEDRQRRRRSEKPGKVQAIAIMSLVGGIWAVLFALGVAGGSRGICCLWPGTYYCIVAGILAIVKGAQLLGEGAHLSPVPMTTGILFIINIVSGDVVALVLGILIVVFCNDPEVRTYFRG